MYAISNFNIKVVVFFKVFYDVHVDACHDQKYGDSVMFCSYWVVKNRSACIWLENMIVAIVEPHV